MIYLVNEKHSYTIDGYLGCHRAGDLAERIQVLSYQELPRRHRLPADTYVFSDLERLTPTQMELATSVWEQLARAGSKVRLLNNPSAVLTRYSLLTELHASGWNAFRAERATGNPCDLRFPVFVREEHEHTGSLTDLLHSPEELQKSLAKLTSIATPLGLQDLLVVEFCDTSADVGFHRKLSAFKIGERIFPCDSYRCDHWMAKAHTCQWSEESVREEWEFMDENPHANWLAEIFDLAHIDYGRIDYGFLGNRPQVWEINTNPRVGPRPSHWTPLSANPPNWVKERRAPTRDRFHEQFRGALRDIDLDGLREPGGPDIELRLDERLVRRLRWERTTERSSELLNRVRRRLRRSLSKVGRSTHSALP